MNRSDALVKALGWPATVLHGDPSSLDRWLWLRRHVVQGSSKVLDAGCGSGAYTMYMAKIGHPSLGISIDSGSLEKARERAEVLKIRNVEFKSIDLRQLHQFRDSLGIFDQILCMETMEHIQDDRKLLRDLASLLKPGGRILITTPFRHYRPLRGDKLSATEDGGHVRWGYTFEDFRDLFNAAGLEMQSQEYISGWVSQKLINLHRRMESLGPCCSWTLLFPLRLLQIFNTPLSKLMNYPYLSVGVVGIKRVS